MMRRLLLIAGVAFSPGLVPAAPSRPDPEDRNLAVLKRRLGVDRLMAQATTRPARPRVLRVWGGLAKDMAFLSGWSVTSMMLRPVVPYGMAETYILKRQRGPAEERAEEVGSLVPDGVTSRPFTAAERPETVRIKVCVGTSARAAMEMALRTMATTTAPIEFFARHLSLSRKGPGDIAVVVKFREGTEGPVVFFVRDNIAVVFQGGLDKSQGLAQSLDDDIKTAEKIDEAAYQVLCPPPVVSGAVLRRSTERKRIILHLRLTSSSPPPPENCEIRAVFNTTDTGYRGEYNAQQGLMEFNMVTETWPSEYGVVVYDRASLLSRWATGKIPDSE